MFGILNPLIFLFMGYFFYVFINNKDAPISLKILSLVMILPLIIFNIKNSNGIFNLDTCEAVEGGLYFYYFYFFNFIVTLSVLIYGVLSYYKSNKKKQIFYLLLGIELFLVSFFSSIL
jgi:hypothetical protein